jgi:hypothetical protein
MLDDKQNVCGETIESVVPILIAYTMPAAGVPPYTRSKERHHNFSPRVPDLKKVVPWSTFFEHPCDWTKFGINTVHPTGWVVCWTARHDNVGQDTLTPSTNCTVQHLRYEKLDDKVDC